MKTTGLVSFSIFTLVSMTSFVTTSCASKALKYEKSAQLSKNEEFDKAIQIEHTEPALPDSDDDEAGSDGKASDSSKSSTASSTEASTEKSSAATSSTVTSSTKTTSTVNPSATPSPAEVAAMKAGKKSGAKSSSSAKNKADADGKKAAKSAKKKSSTKATATAAADATPETPAKRQPDIEDDEGFNGRRPVVDPFHVGEVVTHDVHYFKVSAGTLKLKVAPFVNVNGRKAYNFVTEIKSSSMFSSVYSVDDKVDNFVDFETLVPRVFTLHVKETSQLREARMIFDEKALKATYWEKKVTEKSGEEEKKQNWDILPYSQNVFSAAFYMRVFQWDVGKEISFRVADDEQNLVFKAKCLRRETLDTALGPKKALVIKPEVTLKGAFKPVGDIYIWLSDDEYKHVLRIESKIKIGTIVSEVIAMKPGRN